MCAAAIEQSPWLMVDSFEVSVRNAEGEPEYLPTAQVLAHVDHEINDVLGGVGGQRARVCLLAGSDLVSVTAYSAISRSATVFTDLKIQTMSTPNLWSPADLDIILGTYGCFVIERSGSCPSYYCLRNNYSQPCIRNRYRGSASIAAAI